MEIIPILYDIRSAHNVGAILRSAECFGATKVICVGITPYPHIPDDTRLPHIANAAHKKIIKTSLGAESNLHITHFSEINDALAVLSKQGYAVWAVEQNNNSQKLHRFIAPNKIALVFGNEPHGIPPAVIDTVAGCIEIEQFGSKESLNVGVAAGIVLYELSKPQ